LIDDKATAFRAALSLRQGKKSKIRSMQERPFRLVLLVVILVLAVAYSPPLQTAVRHSWRDVADLVDNRPARAVLIIGNSRVYANDMPFMIRDIADAASDPLRWDVTSLAKSGATFETHWNNPDVHDLLARRWDLVILQAESAAQYETDSNQRFHSFGRRLVQEARKTGSPVALAVGWVYGEKLFEGYPGDRDRMQAEIQDQHRRFAEDNAVDLINVGRAWSGIELHLPTHALTVDGNHPSLAGSYIEALAIYRYLSDRPLFVAAYRPDGMSVADAKSIASEIERRISSKLRLRAALSP
jgi:hypothetical protein